MSRWLTLLLIPTLGGCIVYDHEGKCFGCDDEQVGPNDEGLDGEDGDTAVDVDDSGTAPVGYKFSMDPPEGYAGDTIIAHLTQTGDFDLTQVTGAAFLDAPIDVLATEASAEELLLTLSIRPEAQPATVSMLLYTADGGNEYVPQVFTILVTQDDPNTGDTGDCP